MLDIPFAVFVLTKVGETGHLEVLLHNRWTVAAGKKRLVLFKDYVGAQQISQHTATMITYIYIYNGNYRHAIDIVL